MNKKEETQPTDKRYYVHFESKNIPHNMFEKFARTLLCSMDRDIKTETKMLSEVELYKQILAKEHKKNFLRCKELDVQFDNTLRGDYILSIGICNVMFYLINEKNED